MQLQSTGTDLGSLECRTQRSQQLRETRTGQNTETLINKSFVEPQPARVTETKAGTWDTEPQLRAPAEHFVFGWSHQQPPAAGRRQHLPPTPAGADFRRWKCRSTSKGLISPRSRGELGAAVRDHGSGVKRCLYPTPKLRCLQEPKDSYSTRAGVLHHPPSHFPEAMALLLSLLFLSCARMAGASGQETLLKAPLVQQPWLGRWILSDQFKQH